MTVMAVASTTRSDREPAISQMQTAPRAAERASDAAGADAAQERMRVLYEVHSEPLIRGCLHWTRGDRQAAEDLVQETMLRAWLNLDKFDSDSAALRPWLMTVARRLAIDMFRARSCRPREILEFWSFDWAMKAPDVFDRIHDRGDIRTALGRLTEEQRAVVLHVYVLDQTVPQTARRLGIPVGTVKSRLHYALRAVREAVVDGSA